MRRLLTRLLGGRSPSLGRVTRERRRQLKRLEERLGVNFQDMTLLECALTHRSYLSSPSGDGATSNERMEFLGDAVLGLVVSAFLYGTYPEEREGRLTKTKSLAVSGAVLARRAEALDLGSYLRLSPEESGGGGRGRESILADAFEAVVGAVYLDRGLGAAEGVVVRHLLRELESLTHDAAHVNYKSLLQELAQARHRCHPEYRVRQETGPDHHKVFTIEALVGGKVRGEGRGKSKKEAEQHAARRALDELQRLDSSAASQRRRPPRRGRRRKSDSSPRPRTRSPRDRPRARSGS